MARNGSGTYNLYTPGNPVVTGTTISSTDFNNTMTDIASALTQSLSKDGQTAPTANLPMASFKHTGVGDAAARTQYASAGQIQDGGLHRLTSVSGTNTITASSSPAITGYSVGQRFYFLVAASNTGAVTLNINSLGAKSVTKLGTTALVANDMLINSIVEVYYDGTQFQLMNVMGFVASSRAVNSGSGLTGGGDLSSDRTLAVSISGLTEDTSPDAAADFVMTYDTSATANKKALLTNLIPDATTSVKGKLTRATQANMESETSGAIAVTPDVLKYHPGAAKAWGCANATGSSILASYNVSSLTDNGTGDWTWNFTTAFSSANYAAAIIGQDASANVKLHAINQDSANAPTSSAFRVVAGNVNDVASRSAADMAHRVVFFGDQ